jgi:hypothetical protein
MKEGKSEIDEGKVERLGIGSRGLRAGTERTVVELPQCVSVYERTTYTSMYVKVI